MANNNGYHSKNTKNYIKLSIMRNGKFEETNIDYCKSNGKNWEKLNQERMAIESGMLGGLESMGAGARAMIFAEAISMRDEVEAHAYAVQMSEIMSPEEKFKTLHTCKAVKEGVDYLETLLQINFPHEFPNELIHSVLFSKEQAVEDTSPIIEELTPIVSQQETIETPTFTVEQSDQEYFEEVASSTAHSYPDLIDGMDPGLAMFLYERKKELTNNFTQMPEGIDSPEGLLINGLDPGLAAFLINARESRVKVLSRDDQPFEQNDLPFEQ